MKGKLVFEKGQKFVFNGMVLTAVGFFGATGIEYPTAEQAKEANNPHSLICVKNKEYGGTTSLDTSVLIEEPKAEDYGFQNAESFDGESGWVLEGGEQAYFEAMKLWELSKIEDGI